MKKRIKKKMMKNYKPKSIVRNGLKYINQPDLIHIVLKDANTNEYVGIDFAKENSQFIFKSATKTTEDKAFIFVLAKEVFEEWGSSNTIAMLHNEVDMSIFSGAYEAEIVKIK